MAAESLSKSLDENYVMVAAIDFGTTFSGYAFSFKNNIHNIFMNTNWGENIGFQSYKTPTCVMVDSSNIYQAFGYEAEEKYSTLEEDDGSNDFHLYRHFKMMLHGRKKITKDSTIPSIDGKMTSALEIFAMALRYLKDHLIKVVSQQTTVVSASLIRWVITVPAIWNEEGKQFMREAALQAGIIRTKDSRQLVIALEPEAASVYCRSLDVNKFIISSGGDQSQASFRKGTKYLLIDAGGGTVDLTAHEVLPTGGVKEILTASGGAWGGTKVDENLVNMLKDVLGSNFIRAFQEQCPQQWLNFMVNVERLKRSAKPEDSCRICITIPFGMASKYQELYGKGIDKAIKKAEKPGVSFSNGMMILNYDVVLSLFQPVIDEIVSHIDKLLKDPAMKDCSYIMLVGGFAESAFLQKAILDKFKSRVNVLVPEEGQMSVIKGAVLYGHKPDDIEIRKARKSYGIASTQIFQSKIHDKEHQITVEGKTMCNNIFSIFVKKGEDLKVGKTTDKIFNPIYHDQKQLDLLMYESDNPNVKYVVEQGCKLLGKLTVEMPNVKKDLKRNVEVKMIFAGTEIQVEAHDVASGGTAEATIDFLCD